MFQTHNLIILVQIQLKNSSDAYNSILPKRISCEFKAKKG